MSEPLKHLEEFHLAQKCLEGDPSAIDCLRRQFGPVISGYLIHRGATPDEARELVAEFWANLVAPIGTRQARLRNYNGACALQTWLNTVAFNELIERKRRQKLWVELNPDRSLPKEGMDDDEIEASGGAPSESREAALLEIMRDAIQFAFMNCDAEDFVLLQLADLDGLQGRELAVMFGIDAPAISRRLKAARERIAKETLFQIRRTDPWIELRWEDFTELCQTAAPACFGDADAL